MYLCALIINNFDAKLILVSFYKEKTVFLFFEFYK
jgi:hypothetical protein